MNGPKQIGGGSAGASVVRDLQQHRLGMLLDDVPFGWTLRVAFEQGGRPAESGGKHQAIVVRAHGSGNLVAAGGEHADMRPAIIELIAIFFYGYFHARSLGLLEDRQQLARGFVDAYPEFSRVEICNHRGHTAEVVGVRMGDRDDVETIDASIPEI